MSEKSKLVPLIASEKSVDELATLIRRLALPPESGLQTLAMALVLKAETMETMLELIYEEVRLLDTSSSQYQRLAAIRDLATVGSDLWKRCCSDLRERTSQRQSCD